MNCNEFIAAAIEKVEEGQNERAWSLFKRALEISGKNRGYVLFEMGKFCFFCEDYEQAMEYFIEAYKKNYNRRQVKEIILEAFYYPNEKEIKEQYEKNINVLMNYPYKQVVKFRNYEQLDYLFIPVTGEKMVIFDKRSQDFEKNYHKNNRTINVDEKKPGNVVLIGNEFFTDNILAVKNATFEPNRFHTMRNALYLYYENQEEFENYLQVLNLSDITEDDRTVFLFGKEETCEWFNNLMYELPSFVFGNLEHNKEVIKIINELKNNRKLDFKENYDKVVSYYVKLGKTGIIERINSEMPKVYIPTGRFTTALQYHARDCKVVLEELECEVLLSIEKNDLQIYNVFQRMTDLAEFLPDLILSIDHLREEIDPKELVHVTWIQDPLPRIMNYEAPKKLTSMDVILNAFFSSEDLINFGYPVQKMIAGPIGVNDRIYYERDIEPEFYKKYKADIIAFSNTGDHEKGFSDFCKQIKPLIDQNYQIKEVFYKLYQKIYKNAYNGVNVYSKVQYKELIHKEMVKNKWSIDSDKTGQIAEMFRHSVGYRILRSVPLEWLAESGYDLKIYGDEWVNHKKLKKYAMGRAENGEVLSKIINCSKIVVGTNQSITTHPRVGEAYLSGSLYIGSEVPKEYDYADIEIFLKKNEEILLYKNKKELFNLIDLYLNNDILRLEVIENANSAIKRKLTHKALMADMIKKIPQIIGEELVGE